MVAHLMMQRRVKNSKKSGFFRDFEKLLISKDNGILYRITKERAQLVLSKKLVPLGFTELHVNVGHLGKDQTLHSIRDYFY